MDPKKLAEIQRTYRALLDVKIAELHAEGPTRDLDNPRSRVLGDVLSFASPGVEPPYG